MFKLVMALIGTMLANIFLGASLAQIKSEFNKKILINGIFKAGCIIIGFLLMIGSAYLSEDIIVASLNGNDMNLLEEVIQTILEEKLLAEKYRDHPLSGNYTGFRECHILPDWLLIYAIKQNKLVLTASRTGTHSDLFGK